MKGQTVNLVRNLGHPTFNIISFVNLEHSFPEYNDHLLGCRGVKKGFSQK